VCVVAVGASGGGQSLRVLRRSLGGVLSHRGWGEGAGARAGVSLPGVAVSSRRRAASTPLPWCIAVSGEGARPQPLGAGVPQPRPALRRRPGLRGRTGGRRAGRSGPGAGYEWSGAGLAPASGDSWEEAGSLRTAGNAVPLWRRKVDLIRGPAAGKTRC
jgi:hypothetical protein